MNKILMIVQEDQSVQEEWSPVSPKKRIFDESWLQNVLIKNPDLLPIQEIDENFGRLIAIGREVPVSSGSIDNIYLTKSGLICLVETKLWRNPEAHRTVVAQIIAYAKDLARMTFNDFVVAIEKSCLFGEKTDFWSRIKTPAKDEDRIAVQSRIQDSLSRGRFLLLIVGDRIYPEVAMIIEAIHSAPSLEFKIVLIEMQLFQPGQGRSWPLLFVPHVVGKTHEITRAIVKVFYEEKKPEIEVEAIETPASSKTDKMTFEKAMSREYAEILMERLDQWIKEGYTIYWGIISFSLRFRWRGKLKAFIDIYPDSIALYTEGMLERRAFPVEPYRQYRKEIDKIPQAVSILSQGKRYLYYRDITLEEFRLLLNATDKLAKDIKQNENR